MGDEKWQLARKRVRGIMKSDIFFPSRKKGTFWGEKSLGARKFWVLFSAAVLVLNQLINGRLHWTFVAEHGLCLVAASGGYSFLWFVGFSLQRLLLWRSPSPRAWAQHSWCRDLAAPGHVGSAPARGPAHVPCMGSWVPVRCATKAQSLHSC